MDTKFDSIIQDTAEILGCDWRLWKAQIYQESRLDPDATSPVGASGLAQIMPQTWAEWHERAGLYGANIKDPEANLITGATYLKWLWSEWSAPRPPIDRHCLAIASYNAGLGHILQAQRLAHGAALYRDIIPLLPEVTGMHSLETINYVRKILYFHNALIIGENIDE